MVELGRPRPGFLRPAADGHSARPYVVVATTDAQLGTIVRQAITALNCAALIVHSGGAALAIARSKPSRLLILDQSLPDITGVMVARTLHTDHPRLPFILVGNAITTSVTVEAMRLGAATVLDKPLALVDVVEAIRQIVRQASPPIGAPAALPLDLALRGPRSSAERWARHVIRGCESPGDLKTLGSWALLAGVSYSSLCECCRVIGVQPLDARDFTRVLRAVIQSATYGCHFVELLDVGDRRTLKTLAVRAGLDGRDRKPVSVGEYVEAQHFVAADNAGLLQLRALLRS